MESFGEYRVGHNQTGAKHWIECRGEIIAQVVNARSRQIGDEKVVCHFRSDGTTIVRSEIPGWSFEGRYKSIGHCLLEIARSHRRFIEPNGFRRLWREIVLWPVWGKSIATLFVLAALAEILGFALSVSIGQLIGEQLPWQE